MSSSLFRQFATDTELEKTGVKIEYADNGEEEGKAPYFVIARAGGANLAYNRAMDNEIKPLRRRLQADNVEVDELDKLNRKVFIKHCLKGWGNVNDENGTAIEFNEQNAHDLFKRLPELYEDLRAQANKVSIYRRDALAATSKN